MSFKKYFSRDIINCFKYGFMADRITEALREYQSNNTIKNKELIVGVNEMLKGVLKVQEFLNNVSNPNVKNSGFSQDLLDMFKIYEWCIYIHNLSFIVVSFTDFINNMISSFTKIIEGKTDIDIEYQLLFFEELRIVTLSEYSKVISK